MMPTTLSVIEHRRLGDVVRAAQHGGRVVRAASPSRLHRGAGQYSPEVACLRTRNQPLLSHQSSLNIFERYLLPCIAGEE